jgi:tRNA(Arg) A34 adenosine deaminase TadA
MCASAIRQAGFREYIYGTSIDHLFKAGWGQILISSQEVVAQSWPLGTAVNVLGSIGTEFTDPLFDWQYQEKVACPSGCERTKSEPGTTTCVRGST